MSSTQPPAPLQALPQLLPGPSQPIDLLSVGDPVAVAPLAGPLIRRLRAAVLRDAAGSGFAAPWARVLFWFPSVGGVLVMLTFAHKPLFHWILLEDHPVEWAQFGALMFTTLAAGLGAVRMARQRRWAAAAVLVLFLLGAFLLGGEEISWGQRVFGIAEPGTLAGANDQGELNVHNLRAGGLNVDAATDYVSSLMSATLLALALAVRLPRALTGRTWRLLDHDAVHAVTPALVFVPALALSAVYSWGQLIPSVGSTGAFWDFEEWAELCRYLSLAGLAAATAARAVRGPVIPHRTLARRARPRSAPHLLEPQLVGYAAFAASLTLIFALLTVHSGIKSYQELQGHPAVNAPSQP
jgi:hypothetical protein